MKNKPVVSRRNFLETTGAVTGAALAAGAFPHPAVAGVKGANERINIAILGPGGRAQGGGLDKLSPARMHKSELWSE